MVIQNPILTGFNPDPSIVRCGSDYYIATSTFEWFPGVQIHHSRDLVHWELHSRPLDRVSQLDMRGVPDSGGIWAPCLTYSEGVFYLVYTIVKERGAFMQTENYLVTTDDINGTWSEPVFLNADGFDPSLFHDDDGRKWLLNLDNHYTSGKRFNGLTLQEYCPKTKKMIGPQVRIYKNTGEIVEGAHIYKRNGYYYLLKAQGGTGINHSAQLSRSRSLFGEYEDCPYMLLTSRDDLKNPLQKAGHADIVETQNGEWYMVHLVGRWIKGKEVSTLGRETAIQKVEWTDDGWLRLAGGGHNPLIQVVAPNLPEYKFKQKPKRYTFNSEKLDIDFQTLRGPLTEKEMSLTARPGMLRLYGKASLNSRYTQSLIARRLEDFEATVTAKMEFEPEREKHLAGLTVYYDTRHWYYLYVTRNDQTKNKEIAIIKCDAGKLSFPLKEAEVLEENKPVLLRAEIDNAYLQFYYSYGGEFVKLGEKQDMTILSDEYVPLGFTGTMVGICCQDLHEYQKYADFEWFEYSGGISRG